MPLLHELKKGKRLLLQHCQFNVQYIWNKTVRHITIDSPPVFIVGSEHSGTTILLAILAAHSRIYAVPYESQMALKKNAHKFNRLLKRFDRWAIAAQKHRWIEKTPQHIHHIGKILECCPNAKILLILRDGRDVADSIKARTGNLMEGINRWLAGNLAGKEYWKHPNVHLFKYENLVSDFDLTIRDILEFLSEEYEDGLKNYHTVPKKWYSDNIERPQTAFGKDHHKFRNWQINQPLFDGRGRWKKMSEQELSLINDVAGEMLTELGYIGNDT